MSVTHHLADLARVIDFQALPDDAVLAGKTCLLDWLGCALAGSREPLTEILLEEIGFEGQASLIGRRETTSTASAALVNGAASHALDYDDTHLHMSGHPSVPVAPAVLALAEETLATGPDLIAAFVAGVETECRLGAVLGLGHYGAGFHATATLGTFGAAAACANLLGLDEEATLHAFGIAGTQAAGLKSVFGSMSKPLHAGKAAANGLFAAKLASRGFTSNTEIIEAHQGFAATHTSTFSPDALDALRDRWLVTETLFKYHASCYLTHSPMEATISLIDEQKIGAPDVEAVTIFVPPGHLDVCGIPEPTTGLEGKFSLRATVAMTLLGDDTADPGAFTDERTTSDELVAIRDRITVDPSADMIGTRARIEIRTNDGRTLTADADVGRPAKDLGPQWDKITSKFVRLATPVIGEDRAWQVHAIVEKLEEADDISVLTAACRPV